MNGIKNLMKDCKYCGEEFRSSKERRVYCSDECFENFQRDRRRKYSQDNKEAIYKRRTTCKYCGNKFKMEELKERCCINEECIEKKKEEKIREAKRKYYNKNIKRKTKKFKKQDSERSRQYRIENAEEINKRDRCRKKEKREWVNNLKKGKKCSKCDEDRWFCLEYHHRDPYEKEFTVAECISCGYGKETILNEIEKCILLCGNCHEHFHHLQREDKGWQPSKEWLNNKEIYK